MRVRLATILCIGLLPFGATAQNQRPAGCNDAVHRQFDFWVGDWTVANPSGQTVGRNTIRATQGGCVLEENWVGGGGGTGVSLNFVERGKWNQVWVANTPGAVLRLVGGLENGAMVMTGESTNPQGAKVLNRVTWTRIEGDKVTQNWDTSTDGGKTWTPTFRGIYTRAGKSD